MSISKTKYIFVTGGVTSSLGKGIISASLGKLLTERGYSVTIQKLDPYINIDPGTMNPYEHGECFVTDDGAETDLDLGHYERFTNISSKKSDNITTGRIYSDIIKKAIISYHLSLFINHCCVADVKTKIPVKEVIITNKACQTLSTPINNSS
mgnify:CR=1 FL=1